MSENIIFVDKPVGITSFDVIRILRKTLGVRKMGHAGTLDPAASGLMIVGVGEGTKKLSEFLKLPKIYEAKVLLGISTTTGDLEGKIVEQKSVPEIDIKAVKKVLETIVGTLTLPVPIYSAIKVRGKPLYKYARSNSAVRLPSKEMRVFWIKFKKLERTLVDKNSTKSFTIELEVASGTYIRSIVEEIGRRLGYPATLQNLRRTAIGPFPVTQAQQL